jgi:hypothetical protein
MEIELEPIGFLVNSPRRNRAALRYRPDNWQFDGVVLMKDDTKIAVCARLRSYQGKPVLECTLTP